MTTREFREEWTKVDDNLRPIALTTLENLDLTPAAIEFLNISGLPESAAPFLSFVGDVNEANRFDTIDRLPKYFQFLESEFNNYVVLGSDSNGDVICLNTTNDCIVERLDHEDYFSPDFVNTSINQLANCLLVYRQFVATVNKGSDENASYDTTFTDAHFDTLQDILETIDERATKEGFWKDELDILLANREEARSNGTTIN